jgi:pyruvate/2-oxoglutarate dehydrogenase complex dihydrolipoamide dehydrogenase (E3) component
VGLSEAEAREKGLKFRTFTQEFHDLDRALIDGEEEGFVKIHAAQRSDRILGATIVARHASEMIGEMTLAIARKFGLATLAGIINPYPTQAEGLKRVADAYNRTRLTPLVKKILGAWLGFSR